VFGVGFVALSNMSNAQDVHVRVSPDMPPGTEATIEFPAIEKSGF
jgi:hypothetical protein